MSNTGDDESRPAGEFGDGDPDRIPSQAELDAEDLAELHRTSEDRDRASIYPARPDDPGRPPAALAAHAVGAWWGAAAAGLICMVYGFANLSLITDSLRLRLIEGVRVDPRNAAPVDRIDSLSSFFPPVMLALIAVLVLLEYLCLTGMIRRNSRGLRSVFLSMVVVNMLAIPMGVDLLFDYDGLSPVIRLLSWAQFALLGFAALFTLRKAVDRWLPPSDRIRPTRVFRGR